MPPPLIPTFSPFRTVRRGKSFPAACGREFDLSRGFAAGIAPRIDGDTPLPSSPQPTISMHTTVLIALDWFGIAVFAATGALVASRKEMDVFGFALLATVTGVGGGTVRDVLLGAPAGVLDPGARLRSRLRHRRGSPVLHRPSTLPRYRLLLWFDAVGLAVRRGRRGTGDGGWCRAHHRHRHGGDHGYLRRHHSRHSRR